MCSKLSDGCNVHTNNELKMIFHGIKKRGGNLKVVVVIMSIMIVSCC